MTTTPDYMYIEGQKVVAQDNGDGTKLLSVSASNITTKFREAFEVAPQDSPDWVTSAGSGDILVADGNAIAASYVVISKDPWTAGNVTSFESAATFPMPIEMALGISASQRVWGQEFAAEIVSTETPLATPSDLAISSISQATTTLTVNTTLPHGLPIGARIGIRDVSDSRFNYPALVVATVPSTTQFTVTAGPQGNLPSVTAGPFTSGYVYLRSALGLAPNGTSMIFENTTVTNAAFYIRSASGDVQPSGTAAGNHNVTVGTSASVQALNAARTYAFQPTTEYRLYLQADKLQWLDAGVDVITATTSRHNRTQVVPDPGQQYKIRFRATADAGVSKPIAKIVSVAKSGTTTATVVTDVAHGLTTGDYIATYGVRDQTNFANLTAATVVASVVDATTFTVVWGSAVTATAFGGIVWKVNGGNLPSACGAIAQVVQSVVRTSNILTLVGNGSWSGFLIGDYVNINGCYDTSGVYVPIDGAYRVQNIATTTLTLEPIDDVVSPTGNDITLTNVSGAVIKRTDWRLSFIRLFDYERERVEVLARPQGDLSTALPVNVQNTLAATISSGTITTVTTVTGVTTVSAVTAVGTVTAANLNFPQIIADVASAALTTTTTTAAFTPTFGISYQVTIPVTAVSGTSPTLDFSIEESDDSGTNWYKVYDFARITATGIYRSPTLPLFGNRVRYVQTLSGTTPSFTRAVNRLQSSYPALPSRQLVDRSISLTTLNSTTPVLLTRDCGNTTQLVINVGAITTTAPQLQLEGSDDFGTTWYAIGSPLTAVASSTVQVTNTGNINSGAIRARVSTAGVGVTAGYTLLKAHD